MEKVAAYKVTSWNNATQMREEEICNKERLEQIKGFPFETVEAVEVVDADPDYVRGIGGVTPAYKKMWDSIGK